MAEQPLVMYAKTKTKLTITIKDDEGTAIPLTGFTPTLYVHDKEADDGTNLLDGVTMAIDDSANGIASYVTNEATQFQSAVPAALWQVFLVSAATQRLTIEQPFTVRSNKVF